VASPEETRVKNLESELGLLKNQVQQTLLDIREHVLEFTNPFTAEARLVRAWQERTSQAAEANLGGEADLESLLDEDDDYEDDVKEQAQAPAAAAAAAPTADSFEAQPEGVVADGDGMSDDFGESAASYEPEPYDDYGTDEGGGSYESTSSQDDGGYGGAAPQDGGWDDAFEQPAYDDQAGYDAAPAQGGYDQGYANDDQYAEPYEADYADPVSEEYYDESDPAVAQVTEVRDDEAADDYYEPDEEEITEEPEEEQAAPPSAAARPTAAPLQPIGEMISGESGMDLVKMISLVRWVDQNMDRIGKDRVMVILDIHAMSGRITEETRDIVKRLCALDRDDATRVPVKDVVAAILTIDNVLDDRQTQSQRLLGMLFDDPLGGFPQGGAGLLG